MTRQGTSKIISLSAGLAIALATVVIGASQANADTASGVPALASGGARSATATEPGDVQAGEEPITFDDVQERLEQLYFDGQVSRYAWSWGGMHLKAAERISMDDGCSYDFVRKYFAQHIESFKEIVSDPSNVPAESVRAELLAAADQLMQLCVAPEAG